MADKQNGFLALFGKKGGLAKQPALVKSSGRIQALLTGKPASQPTAYQPTRPSVQAQAWRPLPDGRLCFIIDATGSRSETWQTAQKIQRRMFAEFAETGPGLNARVTYFKGADTCRSSAWTRDYRDIERFMSDISCAGGETQIVRAIEENLSSSTPPTAIVLIGDACEEDNDPPDLIQKYGKILGHREIPVFAFLEGNGFAGGKAYRDLAELSGGEFASFGSPLDLSSLVSVVTAYSIGGDNAVSALLKQPSSTLNLTGRNFATKLLAANNG